MYRVDPPPPSLLQQWRKGLNEAVLRLSARSRRPLGNAEEVVGNICDHLDFAVGRANSASQFNAIFLSRVLAFELGLTVPFINLREQRSRQAAQLAETLDAFRETGWSEEALWVTCERCGDRVPAGVGRQRCECGRDVEPLDDSDRTQVEAAVSAGLVQPRVLLDDALDATAWECLAGLSYGGSMAHSVIASQLLIRSGRTPVHDLYWSPRPHLDGPYEQLVATNSGLRTFSIPETTGAYTAATITSDWGSEQAMSWLRNAVAVDDQAQFRIGTS